MADKDGAAWVCVVCGYVHRGSQPPDLCPVCGASREEFERHQDTAPSAPVSPQAWRCMVCDYTHTGPNPPDACPVCGALASEFEPIQVNPEDATRASGPVRVVIVGAGIAGLSAAEAVRQCSPESTVTLVSREDGLPYYRLNLTRLLAGEVPARALPIYPEAWYETQQIALLQRTEVRSLAVAEQAIVCRDGTRLSYDRLIFTAGAHAFVPPFPGGDLEGVRTLRTFEDAQWLLEAAQPEARCVCIGGGILGLETAGALARRGVRVTVLEGFDWLLPRQLNRQAGERLAAGAAALGIALRPRARVESLAGDRHVRSVHLVDGTVLEADFVIVATGIRPNSHLARNAGLAVSQGIVVDSFLRTSAPNVFAAGDVAEFQGTVYGLWEPARSQGVIAGRNAAGVFTEFGGVPRANALKVLGLEMFSAGIVQPPDGSYRELVDAQDTVYRRFLFHDNCLVGVILLGDTRLAAPAMNALKARTDFSDLLGRQASAERIVDALGKRQG